MALAPPIMFLACFTDPGFVASLSPSSLYSVTPALTGMEDHLIAPSPLRASLSWARL